MVDQEEGEVFARKLFVGGLPIDVSEAFSEQIRTVSNIASPLLDVIYPTLILPIASLLAEQLPLVLWSWTTTAWSSTAAVDLNSALYGNPVVNIHSTLLLRLAVLVLVLPTIVDGCSSRPVAQPILQAHHHPYHYRPSSSWWPWSVERPIYRAHETLRRYNCTEIFEELYCVNNGSCYMVEDPSHRLIPACECPQGWRGKRCELIHNDVLYLPSTQQENLQTAALSTFVTLMILAACFATMTLLIYRRLSKSTPVWEASLERECSVV